jgi:hypothetical protein
MSLPALPLLLLLLGSAVGQHELTDFPSCGASNPREGAVDQCLWDCDWIENPYYGKTWRVSVVDQNIRDPMSTNMNFKTTFANVRYFMTTPKIPTNLDCLDDCRLPNAVG